MSLFIVNQEKFQTNSSVLSINTRNKHHLHRSVANLSCFQKGASYSEIRIFNNLPRSITSLKNERTQFKVTLKIFICTLLLLCGWIFCMYWWLCKSLLCNVFICLHVYDMFHILLSCDSPRNVFMYVCLGHLFYFILLAGESKSSSGSHSVAALALTPPPIWSSFFQFIFSLTPIQRPAAAVFILHCNVSSSSSPLSLFSFLLLFLFRASARYRAMA